MRLVREAHGLCLLLGRWSGNILIRMGDKSDWLQAPAKSVDEKGFKGIQTAT